MLRRHCLYPQSLFPSSHLGDEKSSHAGTGPATERVAELEALEAVTACMGRPMFMRSGNLGLEAMIVRSSHMIMNPAQQGSAPGH